MAAYRLIHTAVSFGRRSHCIRCQQQLVWYDLIPILSWIRLRGKCRFCKQPISYLYLLIEVITLVSLLALIVSPARDYFSAYFIFFSALIITVRTDLETLLISRFVTLVLIPVGLFASSMGALPISIVESCMGIALGYGLLWLIAYLFYILTGKKGMGEGDFELLAFIGSFVGPWGVWVTLLIASLIGSLIGLGVLITTKTQEPVKIPFGAFLAGSALLWVIFQEHLSALILG